MGEMQAASRRWRAIRALLATVTVLVALATAGAVPSEARIAGADPALSPAVSVPCSTAEERLVLTRNTELDPSCTYTGGFVVSTSGVTLDCRGAIVQGQGVGHGIDIEAPTTVALHGIRIRNCRVDGWQNGIHITRLGFQSLAVGVEYVDGFSDIAIEHSQVSDSAGVGVYVDGYVTGVTIRHDDVFDNGSSGIYLDTGSKGNVVRDDDIHGNGFVENGPEGTDTTFQGLHVRYWGPGREGLSLDGSRFNRVVGNRFWDNSAGSIFLYKNCGEYYISQAASWLPRRYGSDGNLIADNVIEGGLNGVWVASRMGENTFPMECSSTPYYQAPLESVVEDEATDNVIARNTFVDVTYAVHVEDDRTTVMHNTFEGGDPGDYAVIVGTRLRTTVLNHPVTGTRLLDNTSSIVGNPSPYRWVNGETGTVVHDDRALGVHAGFCQAPEIPHNVMIMVIALAFETPGDPPPPPPDLTVPTIGALPACSPP